MVEMMIAIAVGMVVLSAVYTVFNLQNKLLGNQEQIAELHQNARIAMDMMVREISMAGYNQTTNPATIAAVPRCTNALVAAGTSCAGITDAALASISFTADLNGNGSIAANSSNPNENIIYSVYSSGGIPALGRTSNGSKQPVVEHVQSLQFIYDNAAVENIRQVKITLCTRTSKPDPSYTDPTFGDNYRRFCLSSFAFPRNLALSAASTSALTTTTSATTSVATSIATTTVEPTTTTAVSTSTTVATSSVESTTSTVETTVSTTISGGGSTISDVAQTPSGSTVPKNTTVTVCATITDPEAASVKLITDQDDPITMTLSSGRYCGTIPKHNNSTVNYRIETYDSSGNMLDQSDEYSYEQAG